MCPLSQCKSGETVFVRGITGGCRLRGKLQAMGIMPGEALRIISDGGGPLVIETKGIKLAIGNGMAQQIMVSCDCACPHRETNCTCQS